STSRFSQKSRCVTHRSCQSEPATGANSPGTEADEPSCVIDDSDASARISLASQTPTTLAEGPRIPSVHNTYGPGVLRHRQGCGFESEEGFLQVGPPRPRRNPWVTR